MRICNSLQVIISLVFFLVSLTATASADSSFVAAQAQAMPLAISASNSTSPTGSSNNSKSTASANSTAATSATPSTAAKPAQQTAVVAKKPVKKRIWNLENADILAVIPQVAKLVGKNFIIDPRVSGRISIISTQPMDSQEIYQVFLSLLQTLGYDVVPVTGNTYRILPVVDAKFGAPLVTANDKKFQSNQVVVQVIPVTNVSASELAPIIQPLLAEGSTITAYLPSNSLIIAGHADNVQRMMKIIHQLDQEHSSRIVMVRLKHSDATKMVSMLQSLQNNDRSQGRVSNIAYAADTGTNSVLISGVGGKITQAKQLIAQLDSPINSSGTVVIPLNYLDATKLAATLQKTTQGADKSSPMAMPGQQASVQADKSSNSLVVTANGQQLQNIREIIKRLDVRPKQVLVQAIIAQVDTTLLQQLGVEWGTVAGDSDSDAAAAASSTAAGFQSGVGMINVNTNPIDFQILVHAIANDTQSTILSTPSIMVVNNEQAKLSDGKNIKTLGSSTYGLNANEGNDQNGTSDSGLLPIQSYDDTKVDLTLDVTPQISPNNTIRLKVEQKNDSLEGDASVLPTIDTSDIKTDVMVKSGNILVLGGLIKDNKNKGLTKIPVLGDIPILGRLFQYHKKQSERQSLMVFIRPVIVDTDAKIKKASMRHYEYMRNEQLNALTGADSAKSHQPLMPPLGKARQHGQVALPPPFPTAR